MHSIRQSPADVYDAARAIQPGDVNGRRRQGTADCKKSWDEFAGRFQKEDQVVKKPMCELFEVQAVWDVRGQTPRDEQETPGNTDFPDRTDCNDSSTMIPTPGSGEG